MGNRQGRQSSAATFTADEAGHIKFLAGKLATNGEITQEAFDSHFELPDVLKGRLFRALCSASDPKAPRVPQTLSADAFGKSLALLLKSPLEDALWLHFSILAHDDAPGAEALHSGHKITHFTLESFVRNALALSLSLSSPNGAAQSPLSEPQLHDLLHASRQEFTTQDEIKGVHGGIVQGGEWQASDEEVADLVQNMPPSTVLAADVRACVYNSVFRVGQGGDQQAYAMPKLVSRKGDASPSKLLTDANIWGLVELALPKDLPAAWHSIYSSDRDGSGKNRFCHHVLLYEGPTLLVVRDTGGHVFGAYVPEGWDPRKASGGFYGKTPPMLFSVLPHFRIFRGTGYNENHQYFHLKDNKSITNPDQRPEGLGLGGQIDFFGLWLDVDLANGRSRDNCSSFRHSAVLSSSEEFTVESVEVWGLGGDAAIQAQDHMRGRLEKSQLNARAVDRAAAVGGALADSPDKWMLDLMGITGSSNEYIGSGDGAQQQQ